MLTPDEMVKESIRNLEGLPLSDEVEKEEKEEEEEEITNFPVKEEDDKNEGKDKK